MRIHSDTLEQFPDCPKIFPTEFMSELMAEHNHGQSLMQLNSRGGMGADEIVANLLGQDFRWLQMHPENQWQVDLLKAIIKHAR